MMTPDDIDVWVGLDVGKSAHHAHALDHDGNTLYDKPLKQDEKAIRTMLISRGVPLLTTISAARAATEGITALRERKPTLLSIQEYHANAAAQKR